MMDCDIKDLCNNISALEEFSKCLDPQFRHFKNWEHFAFSFGIPSDVIRICKLYHEQSPSIKVFEYLSVTKPKMTIDELRDFLTRNRQRARPDIKAMLKDFHGNEIVSEVITNSTTNTLDEIALNLDSASPPTCNWRSFCLEVGIPRNELDQFEMYTRYNPTEALFRFLYSTSPKSVKLSVIIDYLEQMKRQDILNEVRNKTKSADVSTIDAKVVFQLGSKLFDEISEKLNKDYPRMENWRGLARHLVSDQYIEDKDIISKLEPPSPHQVHSPAKKVIEWLSVHKPKTKLWEICRACQEIKRRDVHDVLIRHFSKEYVFPIDHNQVDSPTSSLGYSVQETSDTGNILKRNGQRFGLPESTAECMLRVQEKKELLSYLSSGQLKLVVLHSATGYGKTSLLLSVADELISKNGYTCIYIDSKGVINLEDLSIKILTTCGIPAPITGEKEKVKALFKNLNQKCVLILDNADHMFHANDPDQICDLSSDISSPTSTTSGSPVIYPLSKSNSNPPKNSVDRSTSFRKMCTNALDKGTSDEITSLFSTLPIRREPETFLGRSSSGKDEYQGFLIDIIQSVPDTAPNVAILATSWESFTTTKIDAKQMPLPPLSTNDSKKLFLHKCKSVLGIDKSKIKDDLVCEIVKCCSGIPLLLCSAVTFIESFRSFDDGANHLVLSPPEEMSSILSPDGLPCNECFDYCLGVCFGRLDEVSQAVLINVSVFPSPFTVQQAAAVVKDTAPSYEDLKKALGVLKTFNFLSLLRASTYYTASAIRSFVIHYATETEGRKVIYHKALKSFVEYIFKIIAEIEKDFFSSKCHDAIQRYRGQEENLREIGRLCVSVRGVPIDVKKIIVKSFAKWYWINLKLMRAHLLKIIIGGFVKHCEPGDPKYHVESLIFGGATLVKCCHCTPYICAFALRGAMTYFKKAIEAMSGLSPKTSSLCDWILKIGRRHRQTFSELQTIVNCTIISEEAKTEMLLNYGKCLTRHGSEDGLALIQQGIEIRKKSLKMAGTCLKKQVMVALGYNDLACAHSYLRCPEKSIEIQESQVLDVYRQYLGSCHPFLLNALNLLAHSYHALGSYDKAIQTCKTVLKNRKELLGEHHDTARSLFDLGHITSERASLFDDPDVKEKLYEEALEYLRDCLQMRENLAFTPKETAETHSEICGVLERLGKSEEAKEHEEKICQYLKKIDDENYKLS